MGLSCTQTTRDLTCALEFISTAFMYLVTCFREAFLKQPCVRSSATGNGMGLRLSAPISKRGQEGPSGWGTCWSWLSQWQSLHPASLSWMTSPLPPLIPMYEWLSPASPACKLSRVTDFVLLMFAQVHGPGRQEAVLLRADLGSNVSSTDY